MIPSLQRVFQKILAAMACPLKRDLAGPATVDRKDMRIEKSEE
jgi:hypothetical protein